MFDSYGGKWLWSALTALTILTVQCAADERPAPKGQVILTIGGKIVHWNREADNGPDDKCCRLNVSRRMLFDADMLSSLPIHEMRLATPAGENTLGGPRLSDVLQAAGVNEASIRVVALNGSVELSWEEINRHDWILALLMDGQPMRAGQFGPLYLLHKPSSGETPSPDELQRWVSSVSYIDVL